MFDPQGKVTEHLIDGAKASPGLAWLWAWWHDVDWAHAGAFWMALYAILLVLDKVGLLAPVKRLGVRLWHKVYPPPPSAPLSHRTKQDE